MTSLKQVISQWLGSGREMLNEPDPHFNYRVYWTKLALDWPAERRRAVYGRLESLLEDPEFTPNLTARNYRLPELDGEGHSGASLLALGSVLRVIEQDQDQIQRNDDE